MAAFFTGVVRAPLTGIVLIIEMTAGFTMLLPMVGACFAAMLVPTLLRDTPIYEALREHPPSRAPKKRSEHSWFGWNRAEPTMPLVEAPRATRF